MTELPQNLIAPRDHEQQREQLELLRLCGSVSMMKVPVVVVAVILLSSAACGEGQTSSELRDCSDPRLEEIFRDLGTLRTPGRVVVHLSFDAAARSEVEFDYRDRPSGTDPDFDAAHWTSLPQFQTYTSGTADGRLEQQYSFITEGLDLEWLRDTSAHVAAHNVAVVVETIGPDGSTGCEASL